LQIPSKKCDDQIFSATSEGQSASDAEIKTASKPASKRPKKPSKPSGLTKPTTSVPSLEHGELLEVDPNNCRRKRRKTDSPGAKEAQDNTGEGSVEVIPTSPLQERQQKNSGDSEFSILTPGDRESTPMTELPSLKPSIETEDSNHKLQTPDKNQHAIPMIQAGEISSRKLDEALEKASSSSIAANESKDGATTREDKPKKVLRLNPKTGTIGSPPAKNVKPPGDRTRKRTSTNNDQNSNSRIAIFRYGPGQFLPSSIGLKIGQILNKKKLPPSLLEKMELPKVSNIDLVKPPKSVHPLFLGKAAAKPSSPIAKQSSPAMDPQRLIEATILGRTKPRSCDGLVSPSKSKIPVSSSFRSTTKILKFPGAVEPAWPWRGMVHIRGQAQRRDELEQQNNHEEIRSRIKKSKYQAVEVLAQEDIISSLAHDLRIGELAKCIQEINLDEFAPLPECLRLPVKHFEAGTDLQRRVRKELCARLPLHKNTDQSSSEDELQGSGSTRARVHPALTKAFGSIATSLSAFDQGQCETQSWIHKHAPKSAAEVLQTGKEAFILKEWLQTLTVLAVETGTSDRSGSRASSVSRRSAASKHENLGKRKRKAKKLEGFVVSSEEEDNDMDEISEPEDDISPHGTQGLLKKTVIRAGDVAVRGSKESVKLTNAVVISGPHGSGKTAAAYAVAKELGFEVFEINSSSRRSGKDILEKVGDMTRNHLVQHAQNQIPVDPVDEDAQRISDALADDLKSGRQGTMKSFFKSKASAKAKPKSKKPTPAKETTEAKTSSDPKAPAKQQKQSLVLLEEVDVLYEEDKQFWATVINLLAQSKRPIIMTCNDESALPFQSLYLHAIIRFMPPPVDLAVDYMLLVAACEGHALRREPVKALYESRNSDLRASLTELDFWCQFAVGDFKCGLDWYYPRWPRGSDIDMQGNVIRVVSEGSFETGMGWLSQDFLESHLHYLDIEEEMLHEALVGWHLDVGDWQQNLNMTVWAEKTRTGSAGKIDDHAALNMYANFSDAMSVADLCSGTTFAPNDRVCVHAPSFIVYPLTVLRLCLTLPFQNCLPRPETITSLLMSFLRPLHS
jgi:DNA polymerase III delta prime subunit